MNLYRYCGDDPVDNADAFGLEFTGENVPYERVPSVTLPGAEKYGGTQWGVHVRWSLEPTEGGYVARISRLDVAIEKRQIAEQVRVKGEARPRYRTEKQMQATEKHEVFTRNREDRSTTPIKIAYSLQSTTHPRKPRVKR